MGLEELRNNNLIRQATEVGGKLQLGRQRSCQLFSALELVTLVFKLL